ncbi:uncharacterized protein LOC126877692 [Bombus huntii]|uniref:uncharacterized protein LOC126877153 n=1 Tax=Bombus huntii TaxID=85661 RepID=UPI0021AA4402|nr:uncharacterized protein LOC126877153 [Bombus huntii]XP_050495951.1 uncharacterized protein LOC126877178 [Bombus huntii]XP_050496230.1 uncharacterized protein LOC126877692 [Bombus huntii]
MDPVLLANVIGTLFPPEDRKLSLGGVDRHHGFPPTTSLYQMPKGDRLPPDIADSDIGLIAERTLLNSGLLDEVDKLFVRIIATRLQAHMSSAWMMKYLGLTIDSRWAFWPHFELLVARVTAAANALCSLLPNIGGAAVGVRRLYEEVIRSRVLYGSPAWAEDLMASRHSLLLLRRLHRTSESVLL